MGGRAALQREEICMQVFQRKCRTVLFLFLITKQYLLTTERTETIDKQKQKQVHKKQ